MWFTRKLANRRTPSPRDRLDGVRLRLDPATALRNRLFAFLLGALFALVLGVALFFTAGEWLLKELVYENPAFALRDFQVTTDGVLAVDQIKRWAGVRLDDNLLALDLARVKRDLELNPAIESVSIERILPRTLRVRVTEREPVAQINVPRPAADGGIDIGVFQADARGFVMQPVTPNQRTGPAAPGADSFPVIDGIEAADVLPGRRINLPQVQAALRLVLAFDLSPMAGLADLDRIDVSSPEVLVVTTAQGAEVVFGITDVEQELRRWREIYDGGARLSRSISSLDLAVTNNIPVRWQEAGVVNLTPPRPARPVHTRRRHA